MTPQCPYCYQPATLVNGALLFPNRPELARKRFWNCSCGAFIGCKHGTTEPIGPLANAELREAKLAAHGAVDPLWREKQARGAMTKVQAKKTVYAWLAKQLELPEVRMSHLTIDQCRRVVEVCAVGQP